MNPEIMGSLPGTDFMLKCTFCPAESDGTLSIEIEEGMFAPFPICEPCLNKHQDYLTMINSPENDSE